MQYIVFPKPEIQNFGHPICHYYIPFFKAPINFVCSDIIDNLLCAIIFCNFFTSSKSCYFMQARPTNLFQSFSHTICVLYFSPLSN